MSEENKNSGSDQPTPKKKKSSQEDFPLQEYRLVPVEEWEEEASSENEIDLIELSKHIWDNRSTIYKFVAVGIVLGLAVALLSPKEYVSDATLMPEYSTESMGGGASDLLKQYGGLLGIGGGSYNASSNAIRVDLYPQIVSSLSFQAELMQQEFEYVEYDTTASLYEYFSEIRSPGFFAYIMQYTIGLPFVIKDAITGTDEVNTFSVPEKNAEVISLTEDQMSVIENLRQRISVSLNEENGIITVSAQMPNPELAAQVAKFTINSLTEYLVEYRTEKVLRDLEFVEEQLKKAETRFKEAQIALADFDDGNQGNLTNRAQTERQQLQSERDISFNLYNSLTQQFEQAKLKVQEETPVFKVLQPVQVPVEKSEPRRALILITFTSLAALVALIFLTILFIKRYNA